jgi:hypothetical protein
MSCRAVTATSLKSAIPMCIAMVKLWWAKSKSGIRVLQIERFTRFFGHGTSLLVKLGPGFGLGYSLWNWRFCFKIKKWTTPSDYQPMWTSSSLHQGFSFVLFSSILLCSWNGNNLCDDLARFHFKKIRIKKKSCNSTIFLATCWNFG